MHHIYKVHTEGWKGKVKFRGQVSWRLQLKNPSLATGNPRPSGEGRWRGRTSRFLRKSKASFGGERGALLCITVSE